MAGAGVLQGGGQRRITGAAPTLREVALVAGALALSGFTILREIAPHDEGLMLQAAGRIAAGEWPYRDFWWNYGPGQPVLLAGLVKLFGPSLLAWRVVRTLLDAAVALLAYRIVRRDAPEGWALFAGVAVAAAMAFPTGPGPNPPALALALAGVMLAPRSPVGAGALAGAAVLFRPEIGIAGALGAGLSAGPGSVRRTLAAAFVTALVLLLPFLAVAPGDLVDQTVGFLGKQHLQHLPFPLVYHGRADVNKLLEFYMPLVLLAGAGLWLVWVAVRRPAAEALALAPLAVVGAVYLLARTDEFHLVPLSVALAILLALAAGAERRRGVLWAALTAALLVVTVHGLERRAGQALHPPALAAVPGPAGDGVRTSPTDARALGALRGFVDARVPPGEPVLVAPPRFDRVRVGDPLLYVILDRPNPTRYDVMQPGVVTTAAVQREMIGELERARPRVLVRWLDPRASEREPNGSGRSSGVVLLDRWLAARYRPGPRFGVYATYVPR